MIIAEPSYHLLVLPCSTNLECNISECDENSPYRTYDGSCNNLENPDWGKAFTPQGRLMPALYDNGK